MAVTRTIALLLLAAGLVLIGCREPAGNGAGDAQSGPLDPSFQPATGELLSERQFVFSPGSGLYEDDDPRRGQSTTFTLGRFNPGGAVAAFSAITDDGSIEGGYLQLGEECIVSTVYRAIAGQAAEAPGLLGDVVAEDFFETCGVNSEGRFGFYSSLEGVSFVSEPGRTVDAEYSARVALSSEHVGGSGIAQARGALALSITAGVMSYALVLEGNPDVTWSSAHIHSGMAAPTDPGPIWLHLFDEAEGVWFWPSPAPGHVIASAFVTPEQVRAIRDGGENLYVDAHVDEGIPSLGGQLQPPVHGLDRLVSSVDPGRAAGIVLAADDDEARVTDPSGVVYVLRAKSGASGVRAGGPITVTPVSAAVGGPGAGTIVAAAMLRPSGSHLVGPIELTFDLPDTGQDHSVMAFHAAEDGTDFRFVPIQPQSEVGKITITLSHFSLAGLITGDPDDVESTTSSTTPATYDYYREEIAAELGFAETSQLLGAPTSDDLVSRIREILRAAANDLLLDVIRNATSFDTLERGLSDVLQWTEDVTTYLDDFDGLETELDRLTGLVQDRLDQYSASLEQRCIEEPDPCHRAEHALTMLRWHAHAQYLEGTLATPLSLPDLATFCNGALSAATVRVVVTPPKVTVLEGGQFAFEARVLDWENRPIDTPVEWSTEWSSIAAMSADGSGSALEAGVAPVVARLPEYCDSKGVGIVNVRNLSGSWSFVTTASDHDCSGVVTSVPQIVVPVTHSSGGVITTVHRDYGNVTGRITNLTSVRRGEASPPYRISMGPFSSGDTPDCRDFMSDIAEFFLRGGNDHCENLECRPIACEDRELIELQVGRHGVQLSGQNHWQTHEIWEEQFDGGWTRVDATCEGTDTLEVVVR